MRTPTLLIHHGAYQPLWQQPGLMQVGPQIADGTEGLRLMDLSVRRVAEGRIDYVDKFTGRVDRWQMHEVISGQLWARMGVPTNGTGYGEEAAPMRPSSARAPHVPRPPSVPRPASARPAHAGGAAPSRVGGAALPDMA